MKTYVIFDLDNCLSDDRARIPLIEWDKKGNARYNAYHAPCAQDPTSAHTMDVFELHRSQGMTPIFMTGRPNVHRKDTIEWLNRNFNVYISEGRYLSKSHSILLMRGEGDERPSVEIKDEQLEYLLEMYDIGPDKILMAYDDRPEICAMYMNHGIKAEQLYIHTLDAYTPPNPNKSSESLGKKLVAEIPAFLQRKQPRKTDEILADMAQTFKERNAIYGDNYRMVAKLVAVLFPRGVPPELVVTDQWHLFELKLVKLSRFAISGLTHQDSIHDDAVYSAMIESILEEQAAAK